MISRVLVLIPLLLACSMPVTGESVPAKAVQNLVLLRHAEKVAGAPDPGLTATGRARAEFFAEWLGDPALHVETVWSSDYRRSRDTALPLADMLGLEIQVYDPRDLPALAKRLRQQEISAVVIGHSNTTPQLAALLCDCEVPAMPDSDYETAYRLFRVGDGYELTPIDLRATWVARPDLAD